MNDSELGKLLSRADASHPALGNGGLAERVRRRHRRGRTVRRIGVVAAVLFMAAVIAVNLRRVKPTDPQPASVALASRAELAREVESRRLIIEALLQSERRRAAARELAEMSAPAAVALELERERAAGALMEYAAELRRRAAGREAGREYRKVMELFPDSALAMAARRGLENLQGVEH